MATSTTTFHLSTRAEMERFGIVLAELLKRGDVVGLCGDLGAGKTYLAGVVAHALGVPADEPVPSPTFTLIREYTGRLPIFHMDLYRLGSPSELYDLGLWEYYEGEGVCLVEWCDKFDSLWPAYALVLSIDLMDGEKRVVRATGAGRGGEMATALQSAWSEINQK